MSRHPRADSAAVNRTIRFTDAEWAQIKAAAAAEGVSASDWVRARGLEALCVRSL